MFAAPHPLPEVLSQEGAKARLDLRKKKGCPGNKEEQEGIRKARSSANTFIPNLLSKTAAKRATGKERRGSGRGAMRIQLKTQQSGARWMGCRTSSNMNARVSAGKIQRLHERHNYYMKYRATTCLHKR
ncbi:hypothetical protein NDU88_002087 [Pleurodeles waltl]|uniref:Uncharacterized protein n=1 Tax=Pleurodeles waltl TaxID=8319 RepID=A0AAV7TKT1_PLEWA|nr:hypothetical protein NDU88_002087 [Pleurodeles waltl]